MPLQPCYECNKDVSSDAVACPNCGAPVKAIPNTEEKPASKPEFKPNEVVSAANSSKQVTATEPHKASTITNNTDGCLKIGCVSIMVIAIIAFLISLVWSGTQYSEIPKTTANTSTSSVTSRPVQENITSTPNSNTTTSVTPQNTVATNSTVTSNASVNTSQPEQNITSPDQSHIVKSGESLSIIANQYNTTVEVLIAENNITDPSLIRVGQEILIGQTTSISSNSNSSVTEPEQKKDETHQKLVYDYCVALQASFVCNSLQMRFDTERKVEAVIGGEVRSTEALYDSDCSKGISYALQQRREAQTTFCATVWQNYGCFGIETPKLIQEHPLENSNPSICAFSF